MGIAVWGLRSLGVALLGATLPAAAADLPVYTDGLLNGFESYSFGPMGSFDFANPTPVHNGAPSIRLTGNSFNAVSFAHATQDFTTGQYTGVRFWVHGGATGGQQLRIYLALGDPSVTMAQAELDSYITGGAIAANQWREVVVDFTQPPLSYAGSFDRIDLQSDVDGTQPALYLDDVSLTDAAAPPVNAIFADGFENGVAVTPGQLRFSAASFNVTEGGLQATISVERVNGTSGAVGVSYSTSDGTATEPGDYTVAAGMLNWANGDGAAKSFTVTLTNDAVVEANETVGLTLSDATGGAALGAPTTAMLTIVDDDAPAPTCLLQSERDVSVQTMVSDRFTWCDAGMQMRVAVLAHNDGQVGPGGTRGGELREFRYQAGASTRIVRASNAFAAGFGYIVSHRNDGGAGIGADDSPLGHGFTGTFERVFEGRHHAVFRFRQMYPRYSRTDAAPPNTLYNVPVTYQWTFVTGRDNPLWAITWDLSGVPANALEDDSRAPYGELLFDGAATEGAHSVIAGVGWGDRYKFASTTNPVTYGSSWTWNVANTIPYVKLWTTAVDATMGTVQSQTIVQQDAGGYFGTGRWNSTSAAGNACTVFGNNYRMPCDFNWPYQSINYSLGDPNAAVPSATNNTRLAWGANFGFLGQTSYATHGSAFWGGPLPNTFASGYPRRSYATFVVLGAHTADPVGAQVQQVETTQTVSLTAMIGTVAVSGPAGIDRVDTMTYAPVGYDPIYASWQVTAASNRIDANFSVGAGSLKKPLLILRNYTAAAAPTQVLLNGVALVADVDFFASRRAASNELWLTLNRDLSGGVNRVQVDP